MAQTGPALLGTGRWNERIHFFEFMALEVLNCPHCAGASILSSLASRMNSRCASRRRQKIASLNHLPALDRLARLRRLAHCCINDARLIILMNVTRHLPTTIRSALLAMTLAASSSAFGDAAPPAQNPLAGTWRLIAADVISPNGSRSRDYGASPKGLLMIDATGHYSLQIFKAERVRFAAAEKASGRPDEFAAAVTGSSTHYGVIAIDTAAHTLNFSIEGASFPNWEGTLQKRSFDLVDGELSYRVQARSDGSVPISVWKRLD